MNDITNTPFHVSGVFLVIKYKRVTDVALQPSTLQYNKNGN